MRIFRDDCACLAIDYQEHLVPVMYEGEALIKKSAVLLRGLSLLGVPVIETRQYPKGLGDTVPEIKQAMSDPVRRDKLAFNCCADPEILAALERTGKKTVVACGMESHVCVLQTVIGLKSRGFTPVLPVDCIGSRHEPDLRFAIMRARDEGAVITTAEALLFELLGAGGSDDFKAISRLVK